MTPRGPPKPDFAARTSKNSTEVRRKFFQKASRTTLEEQLFLQPSWGTTGGFLLLRLFPPPLPPLESSNFVFLFCSVVGGGGPACPHGTFFGGLGPIYIICSKPWGNYPILSHCRGSDFWETCGRPGAWKAAGGTLLSAARAIFLQKLNVLADSGWILVSLLSFGLALKHVWGLLRSLWGGLA